MLKKVSRLAAILAAASLLFGAVGCSDGGGSNNNGNTDGVTGGSDPLTGGSSSGGSDTGDSSTAVSYCWNFNDDNFDASKFTTVKNSSNADKYGLEEDYDYASTPSGMVVTLKKALGGEAHYNLVDKTKTVSSSATYYVNKNTDSTKGATVGCIEPNGELVVLKNVQGPFTVKAYVQCNSDNDKTDRYAYIKIGETEYADATYKAKTTLPAVGQTLTAAYTGADKVDVVIGCGKIVRIYDIVVTSAAAQDQSTSVSTVKSLKLSVDKNALRVGQTATFTVEGVNTDTPSSVSILVNSETFAENASLTEGKYEWTPSSEQLDTNDDDEVIATTFKIKVASDNLTSNEVTVTVSPAKEFVYYSDGTLFAESDLTEAQNAYLDSLDDDAIAELIAGFYTDATFDTQIAEDHDADIYIKLAKTKEELITWITEQMASATKYTVSFYNNDSATTAVYTAQVVSGSTLTSEQIEAASAALTPALDYEFDEWSSDLEQAVTADLSVYATWKAIVYFNSFVATDTGKTSDSNNYEALTSSDGLVVTTARAKYQVNSWSTADYNEESGTGYKYTARVKLNKESGSVAGTMTISNVKVGSVLRIDGGNATSSDTRYVSFTGTDSDSTKWEASAMGTIYVTATASTVVLTSETNEFCIYGIHVVDEKVATTSESVTTYSKPTLALSATSVVKDAEVTVTPTIPAASVKKTYSDGKVETSTQDVTAEITYTGATVTDGKVDTSTTGTLSITASYTIGTGEDAVTYTSDAVTLEVAGAFESKTETITNDADTLGLTATTVSSSAEGVATVAIDSGIKITSVAQGTATITFGDGTNSGTIEVTVGAGGDIATTVNKYSSVVQVSWALSAASNLTGTSTLSGLTAASVTGYANKASVTWADETSKFKYDGDSSYTSVATFTTNLKSSAADCISNGNYAEIVITNNTGKSVTLSKLEYTHAIKDKNSGFGCQAFYWIGDATYSTTNAGTALTTSTYGNTSAILTKASAEFGSNVTVANNTSVTIRFAYYGGNNGSKVCALKDVVLTVAQ